MLPTSHPKPHLHALWLQVVHSQMLAMSKVLKSAVYITAKPGLGMI